MTFFKEYYWTDCKVPLGFIGNESIHFYVCVANRVQLIYDHTNPATCGLYVEYRRRRLRGHVTDVLREPEYGRLRDENYHDHIDPFKKMTVNTSRVKESFDILMRLSRFSSWQKTKRAVALRSRYSRKLRNKVVSKGKGPRRYIRARIDQGNLCQHSS